MRGLLRKGTANMDGMILARLIDAKGLQVNADDLTQFDCEGAYRWKNQHPFSNLLLTQS